jgi:hypothetical protein
MDSEGKKRIMHQGQDLPVAQDRLDVQDGTEEYVTEFPTTEEPIGSTDMFENQTESSYVERQTEGGFQPVANPETEEFNRE